MSPQPMEATSAQKLPRHISRERGQRAHTMRPYNAPTPNPSPTTLRFGDYSPRTGEGCLASNGFLAGWRHNQGKATPYLEEANTP